MRESFIFYRGFYEAAQDLEDADRLKLYDAIIEYALNDKELLKTKSVARAVYKSVKPQIDANNRRYENGRKGGAPKGNKNAAKNNLKTTKKQPKNNQKQANDNANDNENDNANYNNARARIYNPAELELKLLATN